jgi:cytochrome b6-f complex iron-sulfur subunit
LRTYCTHLGCTPLWLDAEQKFKCPCHGSGFSKEGINLEGPAPRPLERYAIRVAEDGLLEVDKSRLFQQELGQWKNPDSYVTA